MQIKSINNTKGFSLLEILITEDYINEERFSQAFCRGKFKIKNWGKRKIRKELKQRNISNICIDKGMEEIKEDEYLKVLDKLFTQLFTPNYSGMWVYFLH